MQKVIRAFTDKYTGVHNALGSIVNYEGGRLDFLTNKGYLDAIKQDIERNASDNSNATVKRGRGKGIRKN